MAISFFSITLILAATFGPKVYNAIHHQLVVVGFYRSTEFVSSTEGVHAIPIPDTLQCEDIHYYAPGNVILGACEDSIFPRFEWFPPLGHLAKTPESTGSTGSIHVIDPKTLRSTRLAFENFNGPFVTHGIDITPDPEHQNALYIFAVNHLSNPDYTPADTQSHPARSQIEIFHHFLNSGTVRHVRSVLHPLVKTPNDLYAVSPSEFYATNDHFYKGGYLRHMEDMVPWLKWTNVVNVRLDRLTAAENASAGIEASVALPSLWAANGMGHGKDNEVLVTSVLGGLLWRAGIDENTQSPALSIKEEIGVDSIIDNPSYYEDPYKSAEGDASGYVLAGLRRAIDLSKTHADPEGVDGVIVWYVRKDKGSGAWEKRVLFEDDGSRIRSASAAVLVPVEPEEGKGKEAMLFVSGFISSGAVAVRVAL